MKLTLKVNLLIAATLGAIIGFSAWRNVRVQEEQLTAGAQKRALILSEAIERGLMTVMLGGEGKQIQTFVESLAGHNDVEVVRIFDTEGNIDKSSKVEEVSRTVSRTDLEKYKSQRMLSVFTTEEGGKTCYSVVKPIFNRPSCHRCHGSDHKVMGILQVSMGGEREQAQLNELKRATLSSALFAVVASVIVLWLFMYVLIERPTRKLTSAMKKVEEGDITTQVNIRQRDELGLLGRSFNSMIMKLHTAQKELEAYHQQQMERADRLATIGELVTAIAHELRNPLTGIKGAISVLSRGFPEDDRRREIVREINLLIGRLNKILEDLLHYARPSPPQLKTVNLNQVIDQTLFLLDGQAKKAQAIIVKDLDEEIPPLQVDPSQMQQVLLNLILNAVQAMTHAGEIVVRTGVKEDGQRKKVIIEIQDTGKGMTAEEQGKAFHPFFSTKAEGTGLGLPIVKRIVENHGGRISLQGRPGEGTRVQVELPV